MDRWKNLLPRCRNRWMPRQWPTIRLKPPNHSRCPLPVSRTAVEPPDGLVTLNKKKKAEAFAASFGGTQAAVTAAPPRKLPNSMIREKLVMSPAGMPGVAPAILEEGGIRPGGAKGNALFFTDTNRGFLGKVSATTSARSRSASICGLCRSEYENSQILVHRDDDNSGGAGYKLNLEKNHLSFYMMHSWPYNKLHVISRASACEGMDPYLDGVRRLQQGFRNRCLYQRQPPKWM